MNFMIGPSGGMADAVVSKAIAFGREGSSPSLVTFWKLGRYGLLRHFAKVFCFRAVRVRIP